MGTWRYVVSRSRGNAPDEFLWEVRELYPADDGGFSYTENSVAPFGESFDELLRDLERMRADASLEVLDLTATPARLVPASELIESR